MKYACIAGTRKHTVTKRYTAALITRKLVRSTSPYEFYDDTCLSAIFGYVGARMSPFWIYQS